MKKATEIIDERQLVDELHSTVTGKHAATPTAAWRNCSK